MMNSGSLSSVFDSVTRQIKALRQTPLEKEVSDATSNDNWGVANSALIQLARETNDFNNFSVIMKGIWEGLGDKREKWRRIFKSLQLLEYCLKYGSDRVCNEARADLFRIRPLQDFKVMEEGRDKGVGIREKAKYISDLLSDAELLKSERAKANENKAKYAGISSCGANQPVLPSGYAYAASQPVMAFTNSSNSTDKLEEYRQKEKLRQEQQAAAARLVVSAEPVISSAGKLVVKNPNPPTSKNATNFIGGSTKNTNSSASCSNSGEENNLIDFDAPVVPLYPNFSSAPSLTPPSVPVSFAGTQPAFVGSVGAPIYGGQSSSYGAGAPSSYGLSYGGGQPYSHGGGQHLSYGVPGGQMNYGNPQGGNYPNISGGPGQNSYPQISSSSNSNMNSNPFGSAPAPVRDSNPFAAFNGL